MNELMNLTPLMNLSSPTFSQVVSRVQIFQVNFSSYYSRGSSFVMHARIKMVQESEPMKTGLTRFQGTTLIGIETERKLASSSRRTCD